MRPPALTRVLAVVAVLSLAAFAGCGDDDSSDDSAQSSDEQAQTSEEPSPSQQREALKDTTTKPEIPKPTGSPPRQLVKEDIVKGKGPAAKAGDNLTVNYVGVTFSTGEEFDASWDRGQPFTFPVGANQVIKGWDKGLVGIRKGGRRMLTIPPEQAYGAQGSPPVIGPNETLVFVVDAVSVK